MWQVALGTGAANTVKYTWLTVDADKDGYPNFDPESFFRALQTLGLDPSASLVITNMQATFDGGRSTSKVYVGFGFLEHESRFLCPDYDNKCIPPPGTTSQAIPAPSGSSTAREAESVVRGRAQSFIYHNGLTYNHENWLSFLKGVRESVASHVLSDDEVGRLLESECARVCRECGSPNSGEMAKRGVNITMHGEFATFVCGRCKKENEAELGLISKTHGVDVLCSCGAIAHIPPYVWCRTCGEGLSFGWRDKISQER